MYESMEDVGDSINQPNSDTYGNNNQSRISGTQ
jgi:hypothetical protein